MRILHIAHQYLPHYVGGVELYTQTLARFQARQQGQQVAIFYPSPQPPTTSSPAGGVRSPAPRYSRREEVGDVRVYAAHLGPRSRTRVFLDTFREPRVYSLFDEILDRNLSLTADALRSLAAGTAPVVVRHLERVKALKARSPS